MELMTIKNVRGYIDEKETAFLNLEDVARGLGFTETAKSGNEVVIWKRIRKYLIDLCFIDTSVDGQGKQNLPGFIPENIFYKLCMKANNQTARKFQDLVCDEILPAIRKNGMYVTEKLLDDPDLAIKAFTKLKEEREKRKQLESKVENLQVENEIQKQVISEFEPVKEYMDFILSSAETMCISQIAADYGLSGHALNKILNEKGIIRKVNDQWILYKEHMNKGYTQSCTYRLQIIMGYKVAVNTKWTQKGRLKIHEILTGMGIKANMDKENKL